MVLNVSVYYQSVVSVLSDDDNKLGLIFRVENEKYSCQCIVSYAALQKNNVLSDDDNKRGLIFRVASGKIMSVCCQSVVSVLSDADNRLTILPVYRQKGRFSCQPVVSLSSVCC